MKSDYENLKNKYHYLKQYYNFIEMLNACKKNYSKKVAFKLKDKSGQIYNVTYEQFIDDVFSLATYFLSKNYKNKRIAVCGKNSYPWCVTYLAASIVGIVVPLDKELKIDEIINFLNISDSIALISDNKFIKQLHEEQNLKKITNSIDFINIDNTSKTKFNDVLEEGRKLYHSGNTEVENIKIGNEELKILLFTSGTTGSAKAVKLSQYNVLADVVATNSIVKSKNNDLFLSILPIHHTYECTIGFLLPIYNGSCIAFCEGLRHIAKNIQEFRPTIVLVVPLLLENVYEKIVKNLNSSLPEKFRSKDGKNPYPSLPFFMKPIVKKKIRDSLGGRIRYFIVGAAAMDPQIIKDLDSLGLNTLQGYGLTECSPLVAGNSDFYKKFDSAGLPIKGIDIRILNPNEEGVGEILVKGPNVMLGYLDQDQTNEVLKDGWFYTGDLGKIDENGYLYITGRIKSVIITKNGKNIYPEEVEHYLNESPLISESLVEGIDKNDNDPFISAQIFPNPEAIKEYFKGKVPTKEQLEEVIGNIVSSVNKKLPNYKHIKDFKIRDSEFEKTTTKKIKRHGSNLSSDNIINTKNNKAK